MLRVLEFLSSFYWILPLQIVVQSLWYSDWKRARKLGIPGILWEAFRAITLSNSRQYYVPNEPPWDMGTVAWLLRQSGIPTFGAVFANGNFSFRVPDRYVWVAERKMQEYGVPLR